MNQRRLIPIEVVEAELGEQAAHRLLQSLEPRLTKDMLDAARRYLMGVPGERIRRLKDRAAFAAVAVHLVRTNEKIRRLVLEQLEQQSRTRGPAKGPRGRKRAA